MSSNDVSAMDREIIELEKKLAGLRAARAAASVEQGPPLSYTLSLAPSGARATLRELFAGKQDLLVIHNMGKRCVYCTLWADELSGIAHHVMDRCGLVLTTPDDPMTAGEFARGRRWNFPVASTVGTSFAKDLGFADAQGREMPGVTAMTLDSNGRPMRVRSAPFGPGDNFCALWHLFDLLPGGAKGWEPKYGY